jgi:DNA-directed RNA polymerase subunit delta
VCSNLKTYQLSFTVEQAREMPMIDIAFEILKTTEPEESPYVFSDLMKEIAKVKQLEVDEDHYLKLMANLFTDMNIDGRFASTRNRTWGLKSWQTLNKDEILNLDDDFEDEEELADFDDDGLGATKLVTDELDDTVLASTSGEAGDEDYKVIGDPYSDEDDENLDDKSLDDELPEIEGLPDLEGEISLEDMKLEEEEQDEDFDSDEFEED